MCKRWAADEPHPVPLYELVTSALRDPKLSREALDFTKRRAFQVEPNDEGGDPVLVTLADMLGNGDAESFDAAAQLDLGESNTVGGGAAPSWTITRIADRPEPPPTRNGGEHDAQPISEPPAAHPLYKCADPSCPGEPYKASDMPHRHAPAAHPDTQAHLRVVTRMGGRRIMDGPGASHTLCGAPVTDRDNTRHDFIRTHRAGWASCPACLAILRKEGAV